MFNRRKPLYYPQCFELPKIGIFSVISFSDGTSPVQLTASGSPTSTKMTFGGNIPLSNINVFSPTKTYKCSAKFDSSSLTVESANFDITPLRKIYILLLPSKRNLLVSLSWYLLDLLFIHVSIFIVISGLFVQLWVYLWILDIYSIFFR